MLRATVGACTSVMTAVERKYFLIFFIVRNAYFTHFSQNFRKISHFTGLHKTPKKPTYFTKKFTSETGDLLVESIPLEVVKNKILSSCFNNDINFWEFGYV